MRLGLYYSGSAPEVGNTWYGIGIKVGDDITMSMYPPPTELPKLQALLPEIQAMAAEVLEKTSLASLSASICQSWN